MFLRVHTKCEKVINNGICISLLTLLPISYSFAEVSNVTDNDSFITDPNFEVLDTLVDNKEATITAETKEQILPSDVEVNNINKRMTREETLDYLSKQPQELEVQLAHMIRVGNIAAIADYLPIYKQYTQRDQSLVEWGEAFIHQKNGEMDKSVTAFRKLNSKFPDVRTLQFHLALALLKNGQYNAAISELEKIKSDSNIPEDDLNVVNNILTGIKSRSDWTFYVNGSYVDDDNITNSPVEGTELGRGFKAGERASGQGIDYVVSADKKWFFDNKMFTSLDVASYGTYYWNNKKYSDISGRIGFGVGYQGVDKEIELAPYYVKQFYGLGDSGNGDLHDYKDTIGVRLNSEFELDNQWIYNNSIAFASNQYIEDYENNDSKDFSFNHTLSYNVNPTTYFYGGVNYFMRDTNLDYNSFNRQGINAGWGQVWPKGFATRTNVGFARRNYEGYDFFGDKRKNDEYNAGISLWNRGFSVFSLTPRINWNYRKVNSNSVREKLEKNSLTIDFNRTF